MKVPGVIKKAYYIIMGGFIAIVGSFIFFMIGKELFGGIVGGFLMIILALGVIFAMALSGALRTLITGALLLVLSVVALRTGERIVLRGTNLPITVPVLVAGVGLVLYGLVQLFALLPARANERQAEALDARFFSGELSEEKYQEELAQLIGAEQAQRRVAIRKSMKTLLEQTRK